MVESILNYQIHGEGPPLLLVHGMGVSFTIWRDLIPLLSPHYKLIIPELPGIGCSPMPAPGPYYEICAEALENLRRELDIPRWHMLGYSMGGWAAHTYAQRWPEAVDHLIFLCIVRPLPPSATLLSGLLKIDQLFPPFGDWMLTHWRLRILVSILGFNGIPERLTGLWCDEIESQPVTIIKRTIRELPQGGRAPLDLDDLPVRFIWGRTDGLSVAGLRPGPRDVILLGGHALPMKRPAKVAFVVKDFLEKN